MWGKPMSDIDPYVYDGDGSIKREKTPQELEAEREEQQRVLHEKRKADAREAERSERELTPEPDFPTHVLE